MSFVPPSGGPADELPPLSAYGAEFADLVMPNDLSELDDEIALLRAEMRTGMTEEMRVWLRQRRLAHFPRGHPRTHDRGTTIFFGVCVALVAVVLAALPLVSAGRHAPRAPEPAALASTSIAVGAPGGLMPGILVTVRGRGIALRDLRPAMFLLLAPTPGECVCDEVIRNAVTSAMSYGVPVYLVNGSTTSGKQVSPKEAERLAGLSTAGAGYAIPLADQSGSLAQLFRGPGVGGVVASFVARDGRIVGPALPIGPKSRVESWLDRVL